MAIERGDEMASSIWVGCRSGTGRRNVCVVNRTLGRFSGACPSCCRFEIFEYLLFVDCLAGKWYNELTMS